MTREEQVRTYGPHCYWFVRFHLWFRWLWLGEHETLRWMRFEQMGKRGEPLTSNRFSDRNAWEHGMASVIGEGPARAVMEEKDAAIEREKARRRGQG